MKHLPTLILVMAMPVWGQNTAVERANQRTPSSTTINSPIPGDDWPRYGHDGALTGRSPIKGNIREPHVAWTYSTAGRDLTIELTQAEGKHRLIIPSAGDVPVDGPSQLKVPGAEQRDLDGSGTLRPAMESSHERWAKILPKVTGLQRIAWSNTWTDKNDARLQLFAYDAGFDKPRRVWESDLEQNPVFAPLDIIYDIDGDGAPEILVAAHYRVMIYESVTGRKKTELQYHHTRPYGWFGLADVDGDGRMELITIGDFQSHIDVLQYDRTKPEADRLSVKWRREISTDIGDRKKWLQIGPHPVADVTGDNRLEIVLNFFNDTGDDEWHVVVLDACTGKTICDIPKRYLQGVADVDGDGKDELFVATSDSVLAPKFARAELVKIRDSRVEVLWSRDNAAWMTANVPRLGSTWSTGATQGMEHVLVTEGSRPTFLVRAIHPAQRGIHSPSSGSSGGAVKNILMAVRCDTRGQPQIVWQADGLVGRLDAMALAQTDPVSHADATMRVHLPANLDATIIGQGVQPRVVQSAPFGTPPVMPIAARLRPNGSMTVVVEGAGQNIFAIEPPTVAGGKPQLLWQRSGRGMADGGRILSPLAADLDGDGGCEVVVADQAPLGHAMLVAYRHDGTPLWKRSFEQTNGGPPAWNIGALTYWWPGHFRSPDQMDLFVNTRHGMMHTDAGHLLDGRDGHLIWTKEKAMAPGVFQWGYAGTPVAVADINGDGRDELISLYPVCFWIADGRDGTLITAKDLSSKKEVPAWAAYGEPMVYVFMGDGKQDILLGSPYILAMLDLKGSPIWQGPLKLEDSSSPITNQPQPVTSSRHALIDFEGDGRYEIAAGGYGDGVRAIDPRDGKVLWSVAAPAPTCDKMAAADIDGRKGDELLYVAGDTLIAITGNRTAGRILWTWKGPATLSHPIIADINGDGRAQIVVQAINGMVICLDGKPE